jgi:protocatechuate 3,4-dioxygenase beta subunit
MRFFAASILWCICAFAQAPDVKPDDKCSVEGTVVDSATGEPVRKARVTLAPAGGPAGAYGSTTDASGHFLIDEVDAGHFSLTASRAGYIPPSSPHGSLKSNIAITLEKGQKMREVVIKLAREGVISGRILDADGDALDGASVECLSIQYAHGKRQLVVNRQTNANELGEFRLAGLAEGRYVIRVDVYEETSAHERPAHAAAGGQPAKERYVTTYYPSTMNASNASAIEVTPGAQIGGIT